MHNFLIILIRIVEVKAALKPVYLTAFGVLPHSELLAVLFFVPGRLLGEGIARVPDIKEREHPRGIEDRRQPGVVGVEPRVVSVLLQSAEKDLAHRAEVILAERGERGILEVEIYRIFKFLSFYIREQIARVLLDALKRGRIGVKIRPHLEPRLACALVVCLEGWLKTALGAACLEDDELEPRAFDRFPIDWKILAARRVDLMIPPRDVDAARKHGLVFNVRALKYVAVVDVVAAIGISALARVVGVSRARRGRSHRA